MSRPAVFLDRDGVLNVAPRTADGNSESPETAAEVELYEGARQACRELKAAGLPLILVTNQPNIARGTADPADVRAINDLVRDAFDLDDVFICPHDDADDCPCRKPKPGMLLDAAAKHDLDLAASVMVGDRWRDVGAGQAAGAHTVFIDRHYAETPPEDPDLTVGALEESTSWIIETALPQR